MPFSSEQSRRLLRYALLCAGLGLGAYNLVPPIGSMFWFHRYLGDFNVFWGIASVPLDLVYERYGFAYPPPSLFLIRPFGEVPFWPALLLWSSAGVAVMILAARRMMPLRAVGAGFLSCGAIGVIVGGQTSLFIGALIIAGLGSRDPRWRGVFLATAAVIKPQSLLMAPFALIAGREWRTIAAALVTAFTLVLLSAAIFGVDNWLSWANHLLNFPHYLTSRGIDVTDVGLYGLARRLGLPGACYLAGFPLALVVAWSVFRSDAPPLDRYAAFACGTVLMSPYTLGYDLAGLSIASVAILLDERRATPVWIAAALIISYTFTAIGIVMMAAVLTREAHRRHPRAAGPTAAATS